MKRARSFGRAGLALLAAIGASTAVLGAGPADKSGAGSMLPGTNSHEPVSIDAGKLDYYDKQQKLVYSGNVVAVQGDSTLKASMLTIFLDKTENAGQPSQGGETAAAAAAAGPGAGSSVRHMDAKGPVTLISKDQIGTGDNGSYDKSENKVTLTGNVTLSQGTNVTKGDRLVYDLNTGQAQVFSGQTYGRVKSVFTPGSGSPDSPIPAASATPAKKKPAGKTKATGSASAKP